LNHFTLEQQSVIESTASTFQLHPGDLSAAIDHLRKQRTHVATSDQQAVLLPRTLPAIESTHAPHSTLPPLEMERADDDSDFGFPTDDQLLPTTECHFGFSIAPTAWSNCFANLLPNENQPPLREGYGVFNVFYSGIPICRLTILLIGGSNSDPQYVQPPE
jgi:hypothetical protein